MKLFPGAKIHIWTEGTKTLMRITDNHGGFLESFTSFTESLTVLSDTENGMKCNLRIEIANTPGYYGSQYE